MKKLIWSVVVAVVVAGGLGFYAGMHYPSGSIGTTGTSSFAGRFGGTGRAGGGAVTGSIVAEDSQSITVKLANGNSQVVFISTSTPITKSAQGSLADLSVGQNVVVAGTANSDGSITAQSIQLRPAGSGAFGLSRTASSSQSQ
jgi:hypothetical protein